VWLTPPAKRFPGFILPVVDSRDDAEESADGVVSLTSTDLELTFDDAEQIVGLRYQNVPLQPGSEIKRAHIQFQVDESTSEPTTLEIRGHDIDHAPAFGTNNHDLSVRANTEAVVAWRPRPWLDNSTPGPDHQTPDLTSIVTEILQRPGWQVGNAMAFLIRGSGKRVATAADGGRKGFPKLVIETRDGDDTPGAEDAVAEVKPRPHLVRLVFADPNIDASPGSRRFDVFVQGKAILPQLDVAGEAGGGMRSLVTKWHETTIADFLEIELRPRGDAPPILCGLEIVPALPRRGNLASQN
jgi:hypothetical protein